MTWLEYCRAVYERRIYLARCAATYGKDSAAYKLALMRPTGFYVVESKWP